MAILPALAVVAFGVSFAYGWACWFLPFDQRDWLILALTTLGLSLGWLTVWMFWVTLIWPGRLSLGFILGGCCIVGIVGLWIKRHDLKPVSMPGGIFKAIRKLGAAETALVAVIALIGIGILFNSVYWPFADEDALVIYAPIAKEIFQTGILPIGLHLYEGYPALVQMAYAYTHFAYGGVNEYLARLVPGLMALGSMGASGVLGCEMRSMRTGMLAAGLVVLTPFFCRWASSGYVDVPGSFYFGLSTLFSWHWWRDGGSRNAALTGMTAGLAMWTKNNALTLLMSLGVLVFLRWWSGRRRAAGNGMAPVKWGQTAWLMGGIVATAGPWYIRNIIVFHFIIPPTLWNYAAQHTLRTLLIMVWAWHDVGATGSLFTFSILYGLSKLAWYTEANQHSSWVVLLIMVIPFYAAWWWLASYDIRFLVMIIPLLGVMAALMLDDWLAGLRTRLSSTWTARARWAAIACILALTPFSLSKAINYKGVVLNRPFMDDAEKHRIVLGGLYDLAMAINHLPTDSCIVGVPSMARYHIDLTRFKMVSEKKIDTPPDELAGYYDYVAYKFADGKVPGWAHDAKPLLETTDGYFLYTVPGKGASKP